MQNHPSGGSGTPLPPESQFGLGLGLGYGRPAIVIPGSHSSSSFSHGIQPVQPFITINTDFVESTGRSSSSQLSHQPPEFTLSNLMEQLEDYAPSIPDSIANHYLHSAGLESSDPRISRLLSLQTQKFIYDILKDSLAISKANAAAAAAVSGKAKPKEGKHVLTHEDLATAAKEYNVKLYKPFQYK